MERHGSETFFVLGEGLLGESLGGRDETLSAAAEAAVPQFRFTRLGPKGTGKQLGEPNRRKIAEAMTVDNASPGAVPAGYTYLGQFIDHDLTFDKTALMENADISPADIEQSRSPSLDLDSLYGNGPQDPGSAKFYSDGLHLKFGAAEGGAATQGFDLPAKEQPVRPGWRSSPTRETTRTSQSRKRTLPSSASTTASSTRSRPRSRPRNDSPRRGRSSPSTTSG